MVRHKIYFSIKTILASLLCAIPLLLSGCDQSGDEVPAPDLELAAQPNLRAASMQMKLEAEIRRATAHYHRVEVAEADGYVLSSGCVASPAGGMGYHYVKNSLMDGEVHPLMPEALVYEPMKNGQLRLVAAEYIVVAAPWDAMHDGPPMIGSVAFNDHRPPGSGGPPFPHYQLHVWLWKHNPAGMYTPFNPEVSCEYGM